ncbi:Uncharacterized protein dnm_046780 [Desulfonema magnum]|uniref:Uncharacterized protein n=1 Tax=Desulfonema magnum TaxID=45655 RepID=A0A975GP38_9BACT|nr:Uncharacterized protein dnm_046780 [Desulfonema magnum]
MSSELLRFLENTENIEADILKVEEAEADGGVSQAKRRTGGGSGTPLITKPEKFPHISSEHMRTKSSPN